MSETTDPRERISGTVVKRTTDGEKYELQPTDARQIRLQQSGGDPDEVEPLTMSPSQFQREIERGEYYFPKADTSATLDAVRALRR